ncbi:MAG: pseudaminic acid synthase [Candidatus Nanopelagicales bacterium]
MAEISCNHLGSLTRALAMIDAAAHAGADAVKFQCWTENMMVLGDYVIEGTAWGGERMPDLYRQAWTPWDWFPSLFDHARTRRIECFASVFDHESLAFLESLGCPRYKIASFEITDLPLISAVAQTGKPVVISTGMAREMEVARAWDVATQEFGSEEVTLLKCTSAYPASAASANLNTMLDMADSYYPVGVSDHTIGLAVPAAATALGATMIEKHLTLSRADGGPDAGFSSEPAEFKAMVNLCREVALTLGDVRYGPTEEEKPSLQFRRSLYWAKPAKAGERVTRDHLRTARPALGASPADLPKYIDAVLRRDVAYGDPVSSSDVL